MARRVRSSPLETRTARLKLPVCKKPVWVRLNVGLHVGYRRLQTAGSWSVKVADGRGGNWIKRIGVADDYEDTPGALTFWDAQVKARELVRGGADADSTKLQTVAEALAAYARDLATRDGGLGNVSWVVHHLSPALASRLVASLDARSLRHWRDSLLEKGLTAASATRVCKSLSAALSLAASVDPRIRNRDSWRVGLRGLPDANKARSNVILSDDQVRSFVNAAYTVGPEVGLFVELAAITGARPIQLKRLAVGDVQRNRLQMPSSKKGKGKRRIERRALPIPEALATRLKQLGKGRSPDAPLLLMANREPWAKNSATQRDPVREAVRRAGLDPDKITLYAMRHSFIAAKLVKGIPIKVIADACDTSPAMIQAVYGRHIPADLTDELLRGALIDLGAPVKGNVVVPIR
jgi:integrase